MTQGHDNLLPPAADAALDNLLGQWAAGRALTAAQAETIYHAILIPNQELSGQWLLDLLQHINQTLSQVTRMPPFLVALPDRTTAERELVGRRGGRESSEGMTAYRPYLRLAPRQQPS